MNVMLPKDMPVGLAEVALVYRGVVTGIPKTILVEAVDLIPRIIAIYDSINTTLLMQSESGAMKVLMEDVGEPEKISFRVGDQTLANVDVVSTNLFSRQFLFSLYFPSPLSGEVKLSIFIQGQELFGGIVKISAPSKSK